MADLAGFNPVMGVYEDRRPGSIGVTDGTLGDAAMQMGIALVLAMAGIEGGSAVTAPEVQSWRLGRLAAVNGKRRCTAACHGR